MQRTFRLSDSTRRGASFRAGSSRCATTVVRACNVEEPSCTTRRAMMASLAAFGLSLAPSRAAKADTTQQSLAELANQPALLEGLLQKESEAVAALQQETARTQEGKLCATPWGVDLVGITQLVALVGALVGGVVARQRKEEVERLNEQLRKINLQLKKKLKSTAVNPHAQAPGKPAVRSASPTSPSAAVAEPSLASRVANTYLSMEEEEMTPDHLACRDALRTGKQLLKEKNGPAAMVRFEKALMLSKALSDKIQERRANRGLAATARLQGQYRTAIMHYERVLDISQEIMEFSGYVDIYGAIADCYTDMGELDKAAAMYDKYLAAMNSEMVAV